MPWRRNWRRDWPAAALAVAALVQIAPLWCVGVPAMPDYPAHLASFWLIGGGAHDPIVARYYGIRWAFLPNLASELMVPALAPFIGLSAAAKLFLSTGMAMWVLGPGVLHRALWGRWGTGPIIGAFFAANANFFWGFFNYYFAAGLSLVVFAAWIASNARPGKHQDEHQGPWRLTAFALAATLVYFCHLFAAAILLVLIAGFEAMRPGPDALGRRTLQVAAVFLPSALAFWFLRPPGAGDLGLAFNLRDTAFDRFESLVLYSFDHPAHLLPIVLGALLLLALVLGRAAIHKSLWLALTALLLGVLFAPEWAMGGWGVDLRLPAFFCALLLGATQLRLGRLLSPAVAGAALLLLTWNAAGLVQVWRDYDRQFAEFRASLPRIPRGARLFTVLDGDAIGPVSDQPYWHMAELAIPTRDAFTALMFATSGQHVVRVKPPYDRMAAATAQQGSPPDIGELDDLATGQVDGDADIRDIFPYLMYFQCHYDEAVVIHLGGRRQPVPDMLHLVHAGSFFSLYDIRPDAACGRR